MLLRLFAAGATAWFAACAVAADPPGTPIAPPPLPAVGSDRTASAELLVARPTTRSCTVRLFARREFQGEARQPIAFVPPADCPGPWSRVVLEADFDVTAGRQFDRTGIINLGGVNLFTGTTMEPRRALAPSWHAERDVTDYAALFRSSRDGEALLTNYVDATYTGRLFWSARLIFYAADEANPAPATADLIEPLTYKLTSLSEEAPLIERTMNLPRNIERLEMDVLVLPQAADEFWYACLPDRFAAPPKKEGDQPLCGAPFRESEVLIDGQLAGIAPLYPWIYTGGMNPALWTIIPGIETLSMSPYRVDLSPFAALLNDGRPHRIALRFAGVRKYGFGMGTLLAWRDHGKSVVTGAMTRNSLRSAPVVVEGEMVERGEDAVGTARTTAARSGFLSGYVDTSHGRVRTSIATSMGFINVQNQKGRAGGDTGQRTRIDTRVERRGGGQNFIRVTSEDYPLALSSAESRRDGTRVSTIAVDQQMIREEAVTTGGETLRRTTRMSVSPQAISIGEQGEKARPRRFGLSTTRIEIDDSKTGCYARTIASREQSVVSVDDGCASQAQKPNQ